MSLLRSGDAGWCGYVYAMYAEAASFCYAVVVRRLRFSAWSWFLFCWKKILYLISSEGPPFRPQFPNDRTCNRDYRESSQNTQNTTNP